MSQSKEDKLNETERFNRVREIHARLQRCAKAIKAKIQHGRLDAEDALLLELFEIVGVFDVIVYMSVRDWLHFYRGVVTGDVGNHMNALLKNVNDQSKLTTVIIGLAQSAGEGVDGSALMDQQYTAIKSFLTDATFRPFSPTSCSIIPPLAAGSPTPTDLIAIYQQMFASDDTSSTSKFGYFEGAARNWALSDVNDVGARQAVEAQLNTLYLAAHPGSNPAFTLEVRHWNAFVKALTQPGDVNGANGDGAIDQFIEPATMGHAY